VTKAGSLLLTGLLIAVLAVLPAGAGPGPKGDDSHGPKGVVHPAGQVYCTSTPLISGTESSAATKCISEVPGLLKQVLTPAPASVRIRA